MAFGATASDNGHPTAFTANLPPAEAEVLFARVASGRAAPADAELFRGQMLTEMARMSLEDGLVMQIQSGVRRRHNARMQAAFGAHRGYAIPTLLDFVGNLKPPLDPFGK